jgi:hypothetical protein
MTWKKKLLDNVAEIFSRKKDPQLEEKDELIERLYKKIGEQEIDLEFLKKKYRQIQSM